MRNKQIFIPKTLDGNSVWSGVSEFPDRNSATRQIFRHLLLRSFSTQVNDLITSVSSANRLFSWLSGLPVHRAKTRLLRRSNMGEKTILLPVGNLEGIS
ncbi:MAG: hypothetical protein WCW61_04855 [Patescibacteria group bacterium]